MQFNQFQLSSPLLRALSAEGYTEPSPIQAKALPSALEGRDVLGIAQTGTGKTAAFALPILEQIIREKGASPHVRNNAAAGQSVSGTQHFSASMSMNADHTAPGHPMRETKADRNSRRGHSQQLSHTSPPRAIQALILAPTRELASQITERFRAYGRSSGIRTTTVFGGVSQSGQVRDLRAGVDVLVACPGRLLDLISQRHVRLNSVEHLVLDEADRMLDMGFLPDIRKVLAQVPSTRQTLLFSATMPKEIQKLADELLRDPVRIEVAPVSTPAERVEHVVYFVQTQGKTELLRDLLLVRDEKPLPGAGGERVLVFTRTKRGADRLAERLVRFGVRTESIHGAKSQGQRDRALHNFRRGASPVLVATDVAARGLDVSGISHVVNFDLPNEPETFVHRIGRTGRAGASGFAVSFCDASEGEYLADIEGLIRQPLPVVESHPHHCHNARSAHAAHRSRREARATGQKSSAPKTRQGSNQAGGGRSYGRRRSSSHHDTANNKGQRNPARTNSSGERSRRG